MNLFSLLVSLTLFSGIFLSVNQWFAYQRKSAVHVYQSLQAISIAANQKYRLLMGLGCQSQVHQNHLTFQIDCRGNNVRVSYSLGQVNL